MASSVRKNTVKLVFGPGVKVPSHLEVFKFCVDNLELAVADIHSIYKDENGGQFYVKIVDEATFAAFISESDESYKFTFDDGSEARVQVEQASQIFRYVRIFNLPPEVEDSAIQYVLGKYGTIRQHVRERFPSELKINVFTGVRGVHMEVSTEIPAHLYIGHFRVRIYYDGLKNKCFYCKAEGHVKSNCPKLSLAGGNGKPSSPNNDDNSSGHSSGSLSENSVAIFPSGRPNKPIIDRSIPKSLEMTNLNDLNAKKDGKVFNQHKPSGNDATKTPTSPNPSNPQGNRKGDSGALSAAGTNSTPIPKTKSTNNPKNEDGTAANDLGDDDNGDAMDHEVSETDRQLRLKRTKSEERSKSSESSGSNEFRSLDDDPQGAFTTVTRSKKSNAKKDRR